MRSLAGVLDVEPGSRVARARRCRPTVRSPIVGRVPGVEHSGGSGQAPQCRPDGGLPSTPRRRAALRGCLPPPAQQPRREVLPLRLRTGHIFATANGRRVGVMTPADRRQWRCRGVVDSARLHGGVSVMLLRRAALPTSGRSCGSAIGRRRRSRPPNPRVRQRRRPNRCRVRRAGEPSSRPDPLHGSPQPCRPCPPRRGIPARCGSTPGVGVSRAVAALPASAPGLARASPAPGAPGGEARRSRARGCWRRLGHLLDLVAVGDYVLGRTHVLPVLDHSGGVAPLPYPGEDWAAHGEL